MENKTNIDANLANASFEEGVGDEGMKRKKQCRLRDDADEENRRQRGWHFRSCRRGRQRIEDGVFRRPAEERENGKTEGDDLTAIHAQVGTAITDVIEKEIHWTGNRMNSRKNTSKETSCLAIDAADAV